MYLLTLRGPRHLMRRPAGVAAVEPDHRQAAVDQLGAERATAVAIPGAKLVIFDGMGRNLPWVELAGYIAGLVQRAEASR
jgi:hypothetical protein